MFIPDEYKQRLNDAKNAADEVLVSVDVEDIQRQLGFASHGIDI